MRTKLKLLAIATAATLALVSHTAQAYWVWQGQGPLEEGGCSEATWQDHFTWPYDTVTWEVPYLSHGQSVTVRGRYWDNFYNQMRDTGWDYTFTCDNGTLSDPV